MLELCYELRSSFINWIVTNQIMSFRRYEISWVYRRAIGHSTPNRFLQGDFDIVGGAPPLTEAEAIKVVMDIATRFFHPEAIHIHLNHGQTLEAIWSWVGIPRELRQNVAELLSLICSSCPLSTNRKTNWSFIRRQLLQDLNLSEAVVDRLQTADLRFCGSVDQALARLRGALSPDKFTCKALEELSAVFSYLKVWDIDDRICLDVLMPPTENYGRGIFFQMYLKESSSGSILETSLLASGGRYDHLVHQLWDHEWKSSPPGAVGVSLALEKILLHSSLDLKPSSLDQGTRVLVCSKGGGGLLQERMELVSDLWEAKMKAEFVPLSEPSLTEQYEYASEHDIKCLVIITEAGLPQTSLLKVRHIEQKKEKEVERGMIVKFLTDAISTNFRNM